MKKKKFLWTREWFLGGRFSLDWSIKVCHCANTNDTNSPVLEFHTPQEFIRLVAEYGPEGSIIVAERSLSSLIPSDYHDIITLARKLKVKLLKISPNKTRCQRVKDGVKDDDGNTPKSNEIDARVIWKIGFKPNTIGGRYDTQPFLDRPNRDKSVEEILKDAHLQKMYNKIRVARDFGYPAEKKWLRQHGMYEYASFCQALIVSNFMFTDGKFDRDDVEPFFGLYALAPKGLVRASFMRDTLPSYIARLPNGKIKIKRKNKKTGVKKEVTVINKEDDGVRKIALRLLRKDARGVWKVAKKEFLKGMLVPESGIPVPAGSLSPFFGEENQESTGQITPQIGHGKPQPILGSTPETPEYAYAYSSTCHS